MTAFHFECRTCRQTHAGIPAFGAEAPDAYLALPEGERAARAELSSDQCVIDDKQFFIRVCLELPVHAHAEPLSWGVWVSVSETSFQRVAELWEIEGREAEPPLFGWLNTRVPGYQDTRNLKARVHLQPVGTRPIIELEPTSHLLAVDQREGLDEDRLRLLIERALHGGLNAIAERVPETFQAHWGDADTIVVFDALTSGRGPYPPVPRLDVFIWRANDESDVTSFVTCGMATQPMPGSAQRRAELHFGVRAALSAEQEHAVARFLANLACYPWSDGKAALGFWHTLPTGIPIPCFERCTSLLTHPGMAEDSIDQVETEAGTIDVLLVLPITTQEHQLVRKSGKDALLELWEREGTDVFVDRKP